MEKKEIKDEEIKVVNGGMVIGEDEYQCPRCKHHEDISGFSPYRTGSGCNQKTHFTCPKCRYEWERNF